MKSVWVLGCLMVSCGGAQVPLPVCPTPVPGHATNAGQLYYSNNYRFSTPDGCFSASYPAPPRLTPQDTHTWMGTLQSKTFSAATSTDFFFINYIELPWLMGTLGSNDTIVNKVREMLLKQLGDAKQLNISDTKVDGYDAKHLSYLRKSGDLGKAYVFVVKRRVFLVVGQTTAHNDGPVKFLKSFALDKECVAKM